MKVQLLAETTAPDEFIRDPAWAAQEKVDGSRCLIVSDANGVRGVSRQGKALKLTTAILSAAAALPVDCVIDGELIGGRFVAFDVQMIEGRDVTEVPMVERFAMLRQMSPFPVVRCATGANAKRQLLETVRVENGEGVVFKQMTEPYRDGRTPAAVKFKFWQREVFAVADVDIARGSVGLLDQGRDCGRCSFPMNSQWPRVGDLVEVRFARLHKSALPVLEWVEIEPSEEEEDANAVVLKGAEAACGRLDGLDG